MVNATDIRAAIGANIPINLLPEGAKSPSARHGARWGKARQIRAVDIVDAVDAHRRDKTGRQLSIIGARITGLLDLEFISVDFPITFRTCSFENEVNLSSARLTDLSFQHCDLRDVRLYNSTIEGDLAITSSRIIGSLGAINATIGCGVFMGRCEFRPSTGMAINLAGSKIGSRLKLLDVETFGEFNALSISVGAQAEFERCTFRSTGEDAFAIDSATFGQSVQIRETSAYGEFRAVGAKFGAQLVIQDSEFRNTEGEAISLERVTVVGALMIRGIVTRGLTSLRGASVGAQFALVSCKFDGNDVDALSIVQASAGATTLFRGLQCRGGISMSNFTATGDVTFTDVAISGELDSAITLDNLVAKSDILLSRLTLSSRLCIQSARVNGWLSIQDSVIETDSPTAISIQSSNCENGLLVRGISTEAGLDLSRVHLRGTSEIVVTPKDGEVSSATSVDIVAGHIDWLIIETRDGSRVALVAARARIGRLELASPENIVLVSAVGWSIESVFGDLLQDKKAAIHLLNSIPYARQSSSFTAQPWMAMASTMESVGEPNRARMIRFRAALHGMLAAPWYSKYTSRLAHGLLIGFGYYPLIAALWIAAAFFVTLALVSANSTVFFPTDLRVVDLVTSSGFTRSWLSAPGADHSVDQAMALAYPPFNPVLYAVDIAIPAANTGQSSAWRPVSSSPLVWTLTGIRAASWILAALLIAGVTGLLKRR